MTDHAVFRTVVAAHDAGRSVEAGGANWHQPMIRWDELGTGRGDRWGEETASVKAVAARVDGVKRGNR